MSSNSSTGRADRPVKYTKEELYKLLPAVYRQRDAQLGKPLEALLGVISQQIGILEDDIDKLYDNWFVETCDSWVVPYIGDLLEAKLLNPGITGTINLRAYVGNTISYRRRKGTVSMVEDLAHNITGWNAKAVEFFKLLETTQNINHLRPQNLRTPDVRNANGLELLDSPFDSIAHTAEVRHINAERGYYNITNLGIFLFRLQAYPVQGAPAFKQSNGCFKFNVLGLDEPLFNNPVPEVDEFQLTGETNVPLPIRRTALFDNSAAYYSSGGVEKSIKIVADGAVINSAEVSSYDLTGWYRAPAGSNQVTIDPHLGRITFPQGWDPTDVHVTYFYGFSSEVGGGFYPRPDPDPSLITSRKFYAIALAGGSPFTSIGQALTQWVSDGSPSAIFEIQDSEVYQESVSLTLPAGATVEMRAAQGKRPTLRLSGPMTVTGQQAPPDSARAGLILNGLLFAQTEGNPTSMTVQPGDLGVLTLRHCTLVPAGGVSLNVAGTNDSLVLTIERTITGEIDSSSSDAQLEITDSIVDGMGGAALDCYQLTIQDSTVLGSVKTAIVELASNTIFMAPIVAKRRQVGCVRFCYVPSGSRVPRPYMCQPNYPPGSTEAQQAQLALSVKPSFTSTEYFDPGYAQLSSVAPVQIFRGADNGAEMGVFNHLLQALRIDNLSASLDEYLRFGLEAGIFMVT